MLDNVELLANLEDEHTAILNKFTDEMKRYTDFGRFQSLLSDAREYLDSNKNAEAIMKYKECIGLCDKCDDFNGIVAMLYHQIGCTYENCSEYLLAEKSFDMAIDHGIKAKDADILLKVYHAKSSLYFALYDLDAVHNCYADAFAVIGELCGEVSQEYAKLWYDCGKMNVFMHNVREGIIAMKHAKSIYDELGIHNEFLDYIDKM